MPSPMKEWSRHCEADVTARVALVLLLAALAVGLARGGHEQAVYPSYYPQEIEIATVAPHAAADLLRAGKLHAFVGAAPLPVSAPSDPTIGSVESLGSVLVVHLNPASQLAADETSACAAASTIVRGMAGLAST